MAIELATPSITTGQQLLAISVVALVAIALAIVRYRLQNTGLPSDRASTKRHLLEQRELADPESLRIPAAADLDAAREEIAALFDAEAEPAEYPTLWSAAGEVQAALSSVYRDYTGRVPRLSLAMLYEALLVAVLGGLAVVPTAEFAQLFASDGELSLGAVLSEAAALTTAMIDTGVSTIGSFPYGGTLVNLAIAVVITLGSTLYELWFLTVGVLLTLAGAVWLLTQRVDTEMDTAVFDSHALVGALSAAVLVLTWLAGVIPAALFSLAGFPEVGAVIGLLAAFLVGTTLGVWLVIRPMLRRLRRLGDGFDEWDRPVVAYVLLRWVSVVAAAVVAPLALAYAGVLFVQGKLLAIIDALLAGSLVMQVLAGVLVAGGVILLALSVRDAWPAVRAGFRESLSRRAVRTILVGRVFPVSIVLLVFLVATAFQLPAALAVAAAIAAGILARVLWVVFQRAKYRVRLFSNRETVGAARVVVMGSTLSTPDGDPFYFATVNTVELAHRDREALVDAIVATAEELFADQTASESVPRQFAIDAFEYGIVDVGESQTKLQRSIREETFGQLDANGGRMAVDQLHDELDEYPEPVWRPLLNQWRREQDLRERNGEYIAVRA